MGESGNIHKQRFCKACGAPLDSDSRKFCSHVCRVKFLNKPDHLVNYSRHVDGARYNRDLFLERTQDGYIREADMGLGF